MSPHRCDYWTAFPSRPAAAVTAQSAEGAARRELRHGQRHDLLTSSAHKRRCMAREPHAAAGTARRCELRAWAQGLFYR
jgi:hypothetical protein